MPGVLTATPLSPALGAVVENFDVHADMTSEIADALRKMLGEHHLLLVRNVDLNSADNRRLLSVFGHVQDEFDDGTYYSLVQNPVLPGSDQGEELVYHCDYSFLPNPLQVVSLYGLEIPGPCANTLFASGVRACKTLPAGLRRRLEGKMVMHASDITGPSQTSQGQLTAADLETRPYKGTLHPAILTHPKTAAQVLFFNTYLSIRVEGLGRSESDALLADVFKHMHAPENVYMHEWRPRDFIIFDNIALTHKRDKGAPRVLRRMVVQ